MIYLSGTLLVLSKGMWLLCLVAQSCPTLCDPMDPIACQAPLSMRILQARILEWVAYPFSSGSSWPRSQTGISCIAGGSFTNWAIREAPQVMIIINPKTEKALHQIINSVCVCMCECWERDRKRERQVGKYNYYGHNSQYTGRIWQLHKTLPNSKEASVWL